MRGHIVKRFKDSYSIVISLSKDPATGKYKQHFESVKGTKNDAEKRLRELLTQLDNGNFIKPAKETLSDYLDIWLQDYVKPNCAPRTYESYEMIVKLHLVPALGSIPLLSLRPEHIQRYYAKTLKNGRRDGKGGLSALTVRKHHRVLFEALKYGVKHEIIIRNVAEAVDPPRAQVKEMQTWNTEEIDHFLEFAKPTPYYALFHLDAYTGMRRSELLALRWQDVDFMFGQLSINRSLHQLKDSSYVFRPPKTAKGKRTIALTPKSFFVLQAYYAEQKKLYATLGIPFSDDMLVFNHPESAKPIRPNSVTRAWSVIAQKAGLKHIRFHDIRHSHASVLLKQGVHPKIVQERLGHSSIQITLDTYSHVTPGMQQVAAKLFDEAFTNSYNEHVPEKIMSEL